jgi:enoyl-CoA hydratase/carnithine racemase
LAFEVRLAVHDTHVGVITIDNPPVNALHPDVGRAIAEHVAVAGDDPELRVLVITGAGRHFMAGGDIAYMQSLDRYRAERYVLGIQEMQDALGLLPQPVIAAINGTALGGGCELAMACDIRIADERAVLGQPEVCLGLIPGAGGTQNLPRLVPQGRAKLLLFTGDRISAAEALTIGLVDQVVAAGTALESALAVAARIAANAPAAVAAAKRAVNLGLQSGLVDGHRVEATLFGPLVETADFAEGTSAFFEKRPATFNRT